MPPRFRFDREEDQAVKRKHGVSLKDAEQIFDQVYLVDGKSDEPEQFRAIGWSCGRLCSVIFEIRHDSKGEYYHLVTAWKATEEEEQIYVGIPTKLNANSGLNPNGIPG